LIYRNMPWFIARAFFVFFERLSAERRLGTWLKLTCSRRGVYVNSFHRNRWANGDSLVNIPAVAGTSQEAPTSKH